MQFVLSQAEWTGLPDSIKAIITAAFKMLFLILVSCNGDIHIQGYEWLYVTKWQLTHKGIQAIIFLLFQEKQEGGYLWTQTDCH
jgi:hypothetical protein